VADDDVAPPPARASVLWDDGTAEVIGEDQLCFVYDQQAPLGVEVVTVAGVSAAAVVQHGEQVVLVLREGMIAPDDLAVLRNVLLRVRATLVPRGVGDDLTVAQRRRRDLDLLKALIASLTGST
jgi:hypothetical protein